jgi:outer membrane lipoprotein LolB
MRSLLRGLPLLLLLAGCASAPQPAAPLSRPAGGAAAPFALNGRISVKHDGERSSANVRWTHRATDDDILLLAPFGQTVAHIVSSATGVVLDTQDKHYSAQDTEALTQKALGWHLPLAGLRNWVLAQPAPDVAAQIERDANGRVSVMHQDGWEIRYTRYVAEKADSLPQRMSLQREGTELQLLIDEWDVQ